MVTIGEFKDWVSTLGSEPPGQAGWWELKARLDAVTEVTALAAPPPTPAACSDAPAPTARQAEAEGPGNDDRTIVDWPPPVDPEDYGRDGGVQAEVVRALRAQQRDLRPARGTRVPQAAPGGADAV